MVITLSSFDGDDLGKLGKQLGGLVGKQFRRALMSYAGIHPEEVDPADDPTGPVDSSGFEEARSTTIEDLRHNCWLSDDRVYKQELQEWADRLS